MATVNQIYQLVNDSFAEAMGGATMTAKDTGSLVSMGDVVMSSEVNIEQFYKALVDRIGRTAIAIREYTPKDRSVKRDELDWGIVYQKISYKRHDAVANGSWEFSAQADPFDIEPQTEVVQKLYSKIATWSYEDSVPDYQLYTAFTSPERMGAFISGIYINMRNALAVADENLSNLAVDTYMAGALAGTNAAQKRNLLTEYNATLASTDTPLTVATAMTNPAFIRFCTVQMSNTIANMRKMSQIFNASGIDRFTPEDKLVVEVLQQFASASKAYLQSDTYHKDLVALPRYEEVVYWQAPGKSFAFADVSSINITNAEIGATAVSQSGIIAFVHDYDAVASIVRRRRDHSIYNPRAERYNVMLKADAGYMVDMSENGVVFFIADAA